MGLKPSNVSPSTGKEAGVGGWQIQQGIWEKQDLMEMSGHGCDT